jgi:hypothetical protein
MNKRVIFSLISKQKALLPIITLLTFLIGWLANHVETGIILYILWGVIFTILIYFLKRNNLIIRSINPALVLEITIFLILTFFISEINTVLVYPFYFLLLFYITISLTKEDDHYTLVWNEKVLPPISRKEISLLQYRLPLSYQIPSSEMELAMIQGKKYLDILISEQYQLKEQIEEHKRQMEKTKIDMEKSSNYQYVKKLRQALRQIHEEKVDKEKTLIEVEYVMKRLIKEKDEKEKELAYRQQLMESREQEMEQLSASIEEQSKTQQLLQKEIASLTEVKGQLSKDLDASQNSFKRTNTLLFDLRRDRQLLEQQVQDAEQKLNTYVHEIEKISNEKKQMKIFQLDLKKRSSILEETVKAEQEKALLLQKQSEERLQYINQKTQELKKDYDKSSEIIRERDHHVRSLRNDLERLKDEYLQSSEKDKLEKKKQINSININISVLEKTLEQKIDENSILDNSLKDRLAELEKIKVDYQMQKEESQSNRLLLEKEIDYLKTELSHLTNKVLVSEDKSVSLLAQHASLQKILGMRITERDKFEREFEISKGKIRKLENEQNVLREQLDTKGKELEKRFIDLQKTELNNEILIKEVENSTAKNKRLQDSVKRLKNELELHKQDLNEKELKLQINHVSLREKEKTVQTLNTKISAEEGKVKEAEWEIQHIELERNKLSLQYDQNLSKLEKLKSTAEPKEEKRLKRYYPKLDFDNKFLRQFKKLDTNQQMSIEHIFMALQSGAPIQVYKRVRDGKDEYLVYYIFNTGASGKGKGRIYLTNDNRKVLYLSDGEDDQGRLLNQK